MTPTSDYNELAASAAAGALPPVPGTQLQGPKAAEAGRRLLMEATGASTPEETAQVALGRPRVGEARSTTHVWKVRAPEQLDALVTDLAARRGIKRSTLIRDAVAEYVRAHG